MVSGIATRTNDLKRFVGGDRRTQDVCRITVRPETRLARPVVGRGHGLTGEEDEEDQYGPKHVVEAHATSGQELGSASFSTLVNLGAGSEDPAGPLRTRPSGFHLLLGGIR